MNFGVEIILPLLSSPSFTPKCQDIVFATFIFLVTNKIWPFWSQPLPAAKHSTEILKQVSCNVASSFVIII
jgi:hypothetical protein